MRAEQLRRIAATENCPWRDRIVTMPNTNGDIRRLQIRQKRSVLAAGQEGEPDMAKMKQMMGLCGCDPSESALKE